MPRKLPQIPQNLICTDLADCLNMACEDGDAICEVKFEDDAVEDVRANVLEFDR